MPSVRIGQHDSLNLYNWPISIIECSPMARETKVQSQCESFQKLKKKKKSYFMPPCLTLSIIRFRSRVVVQSWKKE